MASNPQNHGLLGQDGEPESSFSVTLAEDLALSALGSGRSAL